MMTLFLRPLVAIALATAVSPAVRAQSQNPTAQQPPAPSPTPASQAPAQPAPVEATPPPGAYSYRPEGRRDPFVSLLGRASDTRSATNRPSGLAGFLINEVNVTGIVKGGRSFIAMLRGPDNKTYIVRSGERLFDGSVKSISEKQVVFSQDVNDPLSLIKQREIPKTVRPGGESMQ
jgi:Tfp pilus assembly protein PilP